MPDANMNYLVLDDLVVYDDELLSTGSQVFFNTLEIPASEHVLRKSIQGLSRKFYRVIPIPK